MDTTETIEKIVQPTSQMSLNRDWGDLPNKQICEEWHVVKFEKMSEPVQVCTACKRVNRANVMTVSLAVVIDLITIKMEEQT